LSIAPNSTRNLTLYDTIQPLSNTSDYAADITWAFSRSFALRLGATSLTNTATQIQNTDLSQFGVTQANLQLLYGGSEFIQPFAGAQYASMNIQSENWNNYQNFDYSKIGFCAGLQLNIPLGDMLKISANGMYGTYMSSAYAGLTLCLTRHFDVDAGYNYEYYNTAKIGTINSADVNGSNSALTVQGPRLGISFRI